MIELLLTTIYLGEYIKDSVSIRIFNKTDIKHEDVLNRQTGVFKVPENGAGEYMFTFTVTTDFLDYKLNPSAYFFLKNGDIVEGTNIDRVSWLKDNFPPTLGER